MPIRHAQWQPQVFGLLRAAISVQDGFLPSLKGHQSETQCQFTTRSGKLKFFYQGPWISTIKGPSFRPRDFGLGCSMQKWCSTPFLLIFLLIFLHFFFYQLPRFNFRCPLSPHLILISKILRTATSHRAIVSSSFSRRWRRRHWCRFDLLGQGWAFTATTAFRVAIISIWWTWSRQWPPRCWAPRPSPLPSDRVVLKASSKYKVANWYATGRNNFQGKCKDDGACKWNTELKAEHGWFKVQGLLHNFASSIYSQIKNSICLIISFEIFLLGQAKPVHAWNGFETAIKTAFRAS